MKIQGKVVRSDLEGGLWLFETLDGKRYQLEGGDDSLLQDGQKATLHGDVQGGSFGIGMVGDIFRVERYELGA